jgi:hypothetical protein
LKRPAILIITPALETRAGVSVIGSFAEISNGFGKRLIRFRASSLWTIFNAQFVHQHFEQHLFPKKPAKEPGKVCETNFFDESFDI